MHDNKRDKDRSKNSPGSMNVIDQNIIDKQF